MLLRHGGVWLLEGAKKAFEVLRDAGNVVTWLGNLVIAGGAITALVYVLVAHHIISLP